MKEAYNKIFDRMHIDYKIVKADTGAMGGSLSEEYQAITDIGEDTLVLCDACDYAANLEISTCTITTSEEETKKEEKVHTPNQKTIEEVSKFLKIPKAKIGKTMLYRADKKIVACLISGEREVNELKLAKVLNVSEVSLVTEEEREKEFSIPNGFIGPINLPFDIIMDDEIAEMKNITVGANEVDYHLMNVDPKRIKVTKIADIKTIKEKDICPICKKGHLYYKKGIEIGNLFKLGTKYATSLKLEYLDEKNIRKPVTMGCYGIGPGRIMAAIAEQNYAETKINWPMEIAPYHIALIPISMNDQKQTETCETYLKTLEEKGYEVLYDNREERFGVKVKDMELIGIPIRLIFGKHLEEGKIEVQYYDESEIIEISQIETWLKEKITVIG